MTTTLFGNEFITLVEQTGPSCITIYMPTGADGAGPPHDRAHFKKLVSVAEANLQATRVPPDRIKAIIKPLEQLLADDYFWQTAQKGLAVFSSPEKLLMYQLPLEVPEKVVVGRRFYLKGLLPFLHPDGRFYVLALSKHRVRLIEATRFTAKEVELPGGIPTSLTQTSHRVKVDNAVQFRVGTTTVSGSRPTALYYSHGGVEDTRKKNLQMFCSQVESGLRKILNTEQVPLVLAGVSYLAAFYRQFNTYPLLLEDTITGNPDDLNALNLGSKAWPLVEPVYREQEEQAFNQFTELAGTGATSTEIREIIPAAEQGRVATLLVASDQQQWGYYNAAEGEVHIHLKAAPGDEDLLDLAVSKTFLNKGEVFSRPTQEMPAGSELCAIFRY